MSFTTVCPSCDARLQAPDTVEGKRVKCKKCGEAFVARRAEDGEDDGPVRPAKAAAKHRPRPAADDEDEDNRPRRPSKASPREDDADEDRPRRWSRDQDDEADEPRPKGKKGKKKKKPAGTPVLLFVLIGVGALMLTGAGIGAYVYFSDDKKTDDSAVKGGPSGGGRPGGPGVPPTGLAGGAGTGTAGWIDYHVPDGRFRVKLPQQPTAPITQRQPLPNGETLEVKLAPVNLGSEAFVVGHAVLPAGLAEVPADQLLDMTTADEHAQAKGAVIKSRTPITHQGFPGREVVLDFPGKKTPTVMRTLLAGGRLILLVAASENASPESPRIRAFFESLQID